MNDDRDMLSFDDGTLVALARAAERDAPAPAAGARQRLLDRLRRVSSLPHGYSVRTSDDEGWVPHLVAGIRMKVLSLNAASGYATLLLDVLPGTRFPPHHHSGAEECYVLAGSLFTCGRRLGPGDFIHADADTSHEELWTDEGCRVLLIAPPGEHGVSSQ
jgi:anti-sigma factor ChrR (cupin superfamily)